MRTTLRFLALTGILLAAPAVASAQAGAGRQGPSGPGGPGGPENAGMRGLDVTAILNARRALDLSPRQVAQLDSIERSLFAERQRTQAAMRVRQDSVRQQMRQRMERGERPGATQAQRDSMRSSMQARMNEMRPQLEQMRRRDSTARAAVDRLLTDPQKAQLREMQAERRGFERGMRQGRAGGRGDLRGGQRGGQRGGMRPRAPGAQGAPRRP